MPSLQSMIPDADTALALEPEELAGVLLRHLADLAVGDQNLSRYNFAVSAQYTFVGYPRDKHEALTGAFLEAWSWLESHGLIVHRPESGGAEWFRLTRRGKRVVGEGTFDIFRRASLFPSELLHAKLQETVGTLFLRGDYDTAVFKAFREVEIAVRHACRLGHEHLGVPLMRRAFDPKSGVLREAAAHEAEREAMAHLFAGAIGIFKNPTSHRKVTLDDPKETIEMLMLASHLLRIVETRQTLTESRSVSQPDA